MGRHFLEYLQKVIIYTLIFEALVDSQTQLAFPTSDPKFKISVKLHISGNANKHYFSYTDWDLNSEKWTLKDDVLTIFVEDGQDKLTVYVKYYMNNSIFKIYNSAALFTSDSISKMYENTHYATFPRDGMDHEPNPFTVTFHAVDWKDCSKFIVTVEEIIYNICEGPVPYEETGNFLTKMPIPGKIHLDLPRRVYESEEDIKNKLLPKLTVEPVIPKKPAPIIECQPGTVCDEKVKIVSTTKEIMAESDLIDSVKHYIPYILAGAVLLIAFIIGLFVLAISVSKRPDNSMAV